MSLWKRIRYRLEVAALRLLAWGVPQLSRGRCVRLANTLGTLAFRLDRRGREVALANVECAFGDQFSPMERERIVERSYQNFARAMVDLFWSPALLKPENHRWIRYDGWDAVRERATREKRGLVFASLHAGNWEWGNLACGFAGFRAVAVAETFRNESIGPIFTAAREVSGQEIIPQENSMLRMLRTVKRGGSAAFLADLSVHPTQAATIVHAYGLEMSASMLHAVLAQRGNALVVGVENLPQPDGSCHTIAKIIEIPENASTREVAQACWDYYEPRLRKQPHLWMWPYKHFRYKPRNADRPYPFYAHESGAFEKLRRSSP
jgi:Kdo2-lipid IVA lauroyltransferase/acyltransferase